MIRCPGDFLDLAPGQLRPERLVVTHQALGGRLIGHALDLGERATVVVGLAHEAEEFAVGVAVVQFVDVARRASGRNMRNDSATEPLTTSVGFEFQVIPTLA